MLASRRGRLDFKTGSEHGLNPNPALLDRNAFTQTQVYAVKPAPASEHLLCGINVHDREVSPEGAAHAAGRHDTANRKLFLALKRMKWDLAVDFETVAARKIAGDHQ